MSDLPFVEGEMRSCCIDTFRAYEGPDDDGVSIRCARCMRPLTVRRGKWIWRGEDPLRPTEIVQRSGFYASEAPLFGPAAKQKPLRLGNQPLRWKWGDELSWPPADDHEQGNADIAGAAERVRADINARGGTALGPLKIVTRDSMDNLAIFEWQVRHDSGQPAIEGWHDVFLAGKIEGTPLIEHYTAEIARTLQRLLADQAQEVWPVCPAHRDHVLEARVTLEGPDPVATWTCTAGHAIVIPVGSLSDE